MTAKDMLGTLNSGPHTPTTIKRRRKHLYSAGSTLFLLRAPGNKVWVMQSYAAEVDEDLSFDKLPELDSKLKLPAGWTFEAKKLTIDPRNANGVAHIIRDDLHNVYEGCGFDAA